MVMQATCWTDKYLGFFFGLLMQGHACFFIITLALALLISYLAQV